MTAILRLQLDDKDPVRVNSAINQLAEVIDRGGGGGSGRTLLTANTTLYVATTGSDSNPGTVGSPFLTIQHAYDVIVRTLDTAGFTTTISCASGTYTTGLAASTAWAGGGPIVLNLGGGSINSSGICILAQTTLPATLQIQNGTLIGSTCIANAGTGRVVVGSGMTFGSAGTAHMSCTGPGSSIENTAPYTITGGASYHLLAVLAGASFRFSTSVTITGTPAIGIFVYATRLGAIEVLSTTYSGSTTGLKYFADSNGVINTGGGGANYFPGTTAGGTLTGGVYL